MKKYLSLSLKIIVTTIVLFYIFKNVDYDRLVSHLEKFDYRFYAAAVVLHVILFLFHFLKWKFLLVPLGVFMPFRQVAMICSKGLFFNLFLPTSIGGDVVRMYDSNKLTGRWSPGIISILFERILGFFSISLLGVAMVMFKSDLLGNIYWRMNLLLFPALFGVITALFYSRSFFMKICSLMVPEQFHSKIDIMFVLFEKYRDNFRYVIYALVSVMTAQILNAAVIFLIFCGNHGSASGVTSGAIFYFIASLSIIYVMSAMPSVGGLGVREGAFVAFYISIGFQKQAVIANSLIFTSILYLVSLSGVIPFLLGFPKAEEIHVED